MVHATCVALEGRAMLITGPSGSGKSGTALQLMAFGAALVADDRTCLARPDGGPPVASAVPTIAGLIEARGVGILACDAAPPCRLALVVELSEIENERLPPRRTRCILGYDLPLFHKVESPYFAAALLQYLKCCRP